MHPDTTSIPDGTILFDGVCVLCSRFFKVVAARDHAIRFRFLPIQDSYGRELAASLGIDPDAPATNALILGGHVFTRSDSAIEVFRHLPFWRWIIILRAIPRPIRDRLYDLVARNRYRLFGRTATCMIPSPDLRRHLLPRR